MSDWSSDVCSSDLYCSQGRKSKWIPAFAGMTTVGIPAFAGMTAAWVSAFASSNAFAMHHYQLDRIAAAVVVWHAAVGDADALSRLGSGPADELQRLPGPAGTPEAQRRKRDGAVKGG